MIIERAMTPDWLSNTYLVAAEAGGEALLIDAGGPMDELFEKADEHDLRSPTSCSRIITAITSRSWTGKEHWPDAEVLIHPGEREHVSGATGDLEPGAELELAGLSVQTLHTPGHTNGMISLFIDGTDVFTGDTLFKNSVGGVRAPGSTSYADLKHSIMDVLLQLPPETIIRPGHTDHTTVRDELAKNKFVRIWRGVDPEGDAEVHRTRRARDPDPARRRLRRRPQGVGPLARRPRRHRPRLEGGTELGGSCGVGNSPPSISSIR